MGAPAQQIINRQVLTRCDLLVGVFWTRIGTPTEKHLSGTVEEIEKHIASGKPAMLYFSSQPVALNTVDLDQVQRLMQFKQSCQDRGLYESYDSHSEFKEKFYRQLQLKVNESQAFNVGEGSDNNSPIIGSRTTLPRLTQEARVLLKEASLDRSGTVLYTRYLDGTSLQANGKNFIPSNDRREVVKWEEALELLKAKDLVAERGSNGEVFEITNLGYQIAEMIAL